LARLSPNAYFRRVSPLSGRSAWLGLVGLAVSALSGPASAEPDEPDADAPPPIARGIAPRDVGRPTVRLDRLEVPPGMASEFERHFRFNLRRAARRADWGAKRGARIEFRVKLEEFSIREGDNVIHVRCTALGSLPRGRTTRTFIDFGGNPANRAKVMRHVLEIVPRGIVTRLADIERERRARASRG